MTFWTQVVPRCLLMSIAAVLIVLAGVSFATTRADAENTAPAGSFGTYSISGDLFYNWDFYGTSQQSWETVDWPIRFLFRQNAEIDKVKDRLDGMSNDPFIYPELSKPPCCSTKYLYLDDGPEQSGSKWDADGGIKGFGCFVWTPHMRLYAQSGEDRNYNVSFGYYVVASVHEDFEGFGCNSMYRSWEGTEDYWIGRVQALQASPYNWSYADFIFLTQTGAGLQDIGGGNHSYQADNWGVTVWVP